VIKPPLKVLIAWANPKGMTQLTEIRAEERAISDALDPLVSKEKAIIKTLPHVRLDEFTKAVQAGYDLIHFVGHGGVKDGAGILYFEDEGGAAETVEQRELITLLGGRSAPGSRKPTLVVLNACRTADSDEIGGLLGLAAALVDGGGLQAAIGMGYPISASSAAIFSSAFYAALVRNGQVDYAVNQGREAIFTQVGGDLRDWGIPRLYTRMPEGVIFEFI
jgi:CHAT domain-containing protein